MAKKKTDNLLEVIVIADEVVIRSEGKDAKTYKQGDVFKIDTQDPVTEGLIGSSAVADHAAYKEEQAELDRVRKEQEESAEKAEKDGSR